MSPVIDTTEMYLRTVFELLEEGVTPLRARIAERMQHSGPTVSQTVSRMERDGLLTVHDDRRILLSAEGEDLAIQVMRRHRLAERLLVDVIKVPWAEAHNEACKWEHVISGTVEPLLVDLLHDPQVSVYGTPIPRVGDTVESAIAHFRTDAVPLSSPLDSQATAAGRLIRIGEYLQRDTDTLQVLFDAGILPGAEIEATCDPTCLTLLTPTYECRLDADWAEQLFISPVG
ncbi:MAG: metal-dependent transcriptional regulator [Propionibacteriaceae bacterium]|nr:metal-dependent transcriptional regulator [Propionibacteriaceae bacterium]